MALTLGTTQNTCVNCCSGIKSIRFAEKSDLSATVPFTFNTTTRGVTGVTLAAGVGLGFRVFQFETGEAEFKEDFKTKKCNGKNTQTISFQVLCQSLANRNALEDLHRRLCCGAPAIVELCDGTMRVIGAEFDHTNAVATSNWAWTKVSEIATSAESGKGGENDDSQIFVQTITYFGTRLASHYTGAIATIPTLP